MSWITSFSSLMSFPLFPGKKPTEDLSADIVDFPKRQTPAKGTFTLKHEGMQKRRAVFL